MSSKELFRPALSPDLPRRTSAAYSSRMARMAAWSSPLPNLIPGQVTRHLRDPCHPSRKSATPGSGRSVRTSHPSGRPEPVALAYLDAVQRYGPVHVRHDRACVPPGDPGPFGIRSDHEARVVDQRDEREIEGIAQLDESGDLIAGVGVDGAGQVDIG